MASVARAKKRYERAVKRAEGLLNILEHCESDKYGAEALQESESELFKNPHTYAGATSK